MKIFRMRSLKHWKLNKGAPCQKKNDAGERKESEVLEWAMKSCDLDKGALCHASQRIWGEVWKCVSWKVGFGRGVPMPKIVMPQHLIEEPWRVVSWTREPLANSNIGERQRIRELLAWCHWLEPHAKDHHAIVFNWRTLKSCKLDKRAPLVQHPSIESHYWWCHYVTGLWSVTFIGHMLATDDATRENWLWCTDLIISCGLAFNSIEVRLGSWKWAPFPTSAVAI